MKGKFDDRSYCKSHEGHKRCRAVAGLARGLNAEVTAENADMKMVKDLHGVPDDLRACHTMIVEGYVIEGHVPAEAILKLLREKPKNVTGLAVPGMPVGSPGMEYQDMKQPYQVIAFGPQGQRVFASYN